MAKLYKKGDEKLLSIWMFIIWFIIAFAIVSGVWIFYSAKIDIKELQAQALSNRLSDCIADKGINNLADKEKIFSECRINKNFNNFYFRIDIYDSISSTKIKSISAGDPDLELQYNLREKSSAENFARCSEDKIVVYDSEENKNLIVKMIACSNNAGGKV